MNDGGSPSDAGASSAPARRRKRPISCDVCSSRKVKCIKLDEYTKCEGCIHMGVPCTFARRAAARKPYGRPSTSVQGENPLADHLRSTRAPRSSALETETQRASQAGPSSCPVAFGALFDPSSWLPEAFSPHMLESGSLINANSTASDPTKTRPATCQLDTSIDGIPAEIDHIVQWHVVLAFLNVYHDRLYPRLPIVHWPSFSQDLLARKDKSDIAFRAFVLSLVAYTALQLPSSLTPNEDSLDLADLHTRCHRATRGLRPMVFDSVSLDHVRASYCDYIYLRSSDRNTAADVVLAESMRLSTILCCHETNIGKTEQPNFIESEMRKRVFWLIYGSDRTTGTLTSRPMLIDDDDITTELPLDVEDQFITSVGCFAQPAGQTPIIAGFVWITRLFRIQSRILGLLRKAKRPNDLYTPEIARQQIEQLADELQAEMYQLPDALDLFSGPPVQLQPHGHAFEICKANLLVTHALARFNLYQLAFLTGVYDHSLNDITQSVLKRLDLTSTDYLTANGSSMVCLVLRHKVMYIASFLLGQEDQLENLGIPREAISILAKTIRTPNSHDRVTRY